MTPDPSDAALRPAAIAAQLNQSRKELLDLTLRNSLLNFRPSRTRGLQIIDESPREVFRILVRDGRAMSFRPGAATAPATPAADDQAIPTAPAYPPAADDESDQPAGRHTDNRLQTPYDRAQLDVRLLNTFRFAHTSLEEQGVNILHLALGMLHWWEADASQTPRQAPLILVPARLSRNDARTRFTFEFSGEEIDANLSLAEKLRYDFDIRLPLLSDAEDVDVDDYFRRVADAVATHERWSVDAAALHIGFFSFNRLLIYKDLDTASWPEEDDPSSHTIVKALFGADGFRESEPSIADDDHLDDHVDVADLHQVMDSDSSQTLAGIDVKQGRNLVIQGPPGTGKSQTITNLIAEAIADDKRVLFVAEKMAALEVVKRRLDDIHIGDACLDLHSRKANKRAVLDELKRTLGLGKPRLLDRTEDRAQLAANRTRLNDYCRAVNEPVGRSGLCLHDIVGRLAQLERSGSAEWPPVAIDGAASWTGAEFRQRRDGVDALRAMVSTLGAPREQVFWVSGRRSLLPMDRAAVAAALQSAADAAETLRETFAGVRTLLELESTPDSTEEHAALARTLLRAAAAPDLLGIDHRHPAWLEHAAAFREAARAIGALADLHDDFDRLLTPAAWAADVEPCLQPIRTWSRRWWRFCSRTYRRACDGLRELCRDALPSDGAAQIAIVEAILAAQGFAKTLDAARDRLSCVLPDGMLDGDSGRSRALGEAVAWLNQLHADKTAGKLDAAIHDVLDSALDKAALQRHGERCQADLDALSAALDAVSAGIEVIPDRVPPGHALSDRRLSTLAAWLQRARGNLDSLNDIVRLNQHAARLEDIGLETLVEMALSWADAGVHLTERFEHAWLTALITTAFDEYPSLKEFNGDSHEQIIERFRGLDLDLLQHNRALVAEAHWTRLPSGQGGGQIAVLRREFEKKRRHLPLRRLMTEAGNAILQIKPVFMMSPLSIAKFIPPGSVRFDLVIFDEASQVRPVDALGAILRAGQAVVVGDSRQLPPTSFFDRMADEDADFAETAETTATADLESILGLFCACGAPERMLRWHYRSRHESLIAVSNHEFYDNRLVLFPSPDAGREETGLHFRHHPGTHYERGARKRFNADEAGLVADAVMEHARRYPTLTLGVATFSLPQARRIEDEVELRRRTDPSTETFFAEHPAEPFFVKNLENVQGDERDVMLISVGYGRIEGGYMPMNFGPLNQAGGERRLNVLITRARRRLEVYSNFAADDLDLSRTNARGVEVLKTFLKYAGTGILDVPKETGGEADSPFEEAVADELRARGHTVHHQVGSAGFFIDLAVVDPSRPGRYLLGIECDGATYHSARSARDRDRLRQQVLEGLGWKIHRIWSTDWFLHSRREIEKVEEAIRRAGWEHPPLVVAKPPPSAPVPRDDSAPSAAPEAVGLPYRLAEPDIPPDCVSTAGAAADDALIEGIRQVVQVESPIHVDEAALRLANAAGLQRAGRRIRARVGKLARRGAAQGRFRMQGRFLWRTDTEQEHVQFRRRDGELPGRLRKAGMIAPEEIGAALECAVRLSVGIDRDGAITEASRLFGFKRAGREIRTTFQGVLENLVAAGTLQESRGQLRAARREGSGN